ncbi:protein BTG3 [Latimeria chalumnae]|uniref:protein BTG3 n=1 Tax=Latimeria chalumnae TaxID=7897 RepID=UPI0003C1858C|nr:PREDICTED: protein BTG3-like [Latimeria chalumnae]|eukprot:XP_005995733.1 PREDICTED: protein BTG3-like [Latimeria chalumnae]
MKDEVGAGVDFILRLIQRNEALDKKKVETFGKELTSILCERYQDHWYPSNPSKGQAYRCIRINSKQRTDEVLLQACATSHMQYSDLQLPREVTIWIDPYEVSCRSGEKNGSFTVAHFDNNEEGQMKRLEGKDSMELYEQDTSDYHSENSSECNSQPSSDDEGSRKETSTEPEKVCKEDAPVHQVTEFFYHPAPIWTQYRRRAITYMPIYQPVIGYYIIPKVRKFNHKKPSFGVPQAKMYQGKKTKQ